MIRSPGNLRQWFQDNLIPTVLVITSDDVDFICRKNDLDFADILRANGFSEGPFNADYFVNGEVRHTTLKNMKLRFLSLSEWPAPSDVESAAVHSNIVSQSSKVFKVDDSVKIQNKQDVPSYIIERRDPTPWYTSFFDELFLSLRSAEHETFFHPVACIIAVSSKCETPVKKLTDLFNVQRAPSLFQRGYIDPNIHKSYVVLHDSSEASDETLDKCFRDMKATFGANVCRSLRINTGAFAGDKSDFWAPYMLKRASNLPRSTNAAEVADPARLSASSPKLEKSSSSTSFVVQSNKRGGYISRNDMDGIEVFVKELISKGIIPHMEKKIKEINDLVTANRHGLVNQLMTSFMRKKPSITTSEDGATIVYPFNSLEAHMRQLSDFLFFLQDYSNAQSFYKMCTKDFQRDASPKHFAGAHEMVAISQFMQDHSRIAVENMKHALSSYEKQPESKMFLLRLVLIYYEILKANNNYKESIDLILKPNLQDSPMIAALLLEQAAYCFYYMQTQYIRKYAFHMVMAGNRYAHALQKWHSWRCYLLALAIYENKSWAFIEDHMYSTLGKLCRSLGHLEDSINFFSKVLVSSKQQTSNQAMYMREFLEVVKSYGGASNVTIRNLGIPTIENESVQLVLNDYSTNSNDPENTQEVWNNLEKSMNDRFDSKLQFQLNKPRISVVGESIRFEVVVYNPLQTQLQLSNFRIICDNDTTAADSGITNDPYSGKVETGIKIYVSEEGSDSASLDYVEIESAELVINPSERKKVDIKICPTLVGVLAIKGVSYQIVSPSGVVVTNRFFALRGRRLNRGKNEKNLPIYEPNKSLVLRVIEPMPLLRAEFYEFPKALLHGEECKVILEINNLGQRAMNNVRLKLSHPGFISIGPPEAMESDFPPTNLGKTFVRVDVEKGKKDYSLIRLPISNLAPLQSIFLPVWIHGHQIGSHTFRYLFQYQSESENRDMNYRLLRVTHKLTVLPSIRVSAHVRTSHSKIDEYILATEVTNMSEVANFRLRQISSVSSFWSIQPLSFNTTSLRTQQEEGNNPLDLKKNERSTMYFRLVSRAKANIGDESPLAVQEGDESSVLYSNLSFDGRTIDASAFPYSDFLARHRTERDRSGTILQRNRSGYEWSGRTQSLVESRKQITHHNQNELYDLDLVMLWEGVDTQGQKRFGQHNITNTTLLSSMNETAANQPIRLKLNYPMNVAHDFSDSRLCIVPVTLLVRNCSPSDTIHVTFQALKSSDASPTAPSTTSTESPYFWCGTTHSKIESLLPQKTVQICLQTCFSSAGIYNLNRFRISAAVVGQTDSINITIPAQHLIHIQQQQSLSTEGLQVAV